MISKEAEEHIRYLEVENQYLKDKNRSLRKTVRQLSNSAERSHNHSEQKHSPQFGSSDEDEQEIMRLRYIEAMRQAHFEQLMRDQAMMRHLQEQRDGGMMSQSGSSGYPFKTPHQYPFDYDAYEQYGSEDKTASANYRPGNTQTALRRKVQPSAQKDSSTRQPQLRAMDRSGKREETDES